MKLSRGFRPKSAQNSPNVVTKSNYEAHIPPRSAADRQSFEMEYRLRRFDGVYRWIFYRGVPYYDETGNFKGMLLYVDPENYPSERMWVGTAYYWAARACERMGRKEQAAELYRKAGGNGKSTQERFAMKKAEAIKSK